MEAHLSTPVTHLPQRGLSSAANARSSGVGTCLAFGTGALLLAAGVARRRSLVGAGLALAAVPLFHRGVTGRWPRALERIGRSDARATGAVHVCESIRLERPVTDVYRFWRRLENLPTFMKHLERVTETTMRRSRWIASGPAGFSVEWDAEITNEVENKTLAWRSLPGSDVATTGSVHFEPVPGRGTQVRIQLQYTPPAGTAGAFVASLFGKEPQHAIREDVRHFKQLLEAGETPRARAQGEK